ncbi:MAG: methionyl-tRNA formyltransferase [Lachnospiraceae bacterium]|jgi:methionyl-tRNA formyltransferase|nr:methionyl-tRNA formyltransferase [Lachnospiraceae bacterium]MCI9357021.1 methionyl-tRNA formyltransferase [Lachnospiraceae bacterium]
MKVVYMGTPDFAVETLREIVRNGHEVLAVVTQPDRPKGRGKTLKPTPVKEAAQKMGLVVYQYENVKNSDFMEVLKQLKPDVIVVAAFGQMLPREILDFPPYGCLNVHASLLPKYRGAAPIQWAVIRGEKETGVTIMRMDEGLDTGDMLAEKVCALSPDETGGSLFDKLSVLGAELLAKTLDAITKGDIHARPQPADSPTPYAAMIEKSMGRIDWEKDAYTIERLVRGMDPWPGAFTRLNGKMLKILKASVKNPKQAEGLADAVPGQTVGTDRTGIYVKCAEGCLYIEKLQLEGKKGMAAADFLRGYRIEQGTVLGS